MYKTGSEFKDKMWQWQPLRTRLSHSALLTEVGGSSQQWYEGK